MCWTLSKRSRPTMQFAVLRRSLYLHGVGELWARDVHGLLRCLIKGSNCRANSDGLVPVASAVESNY